jgi:hypothetical protein
MIYSLKVWIVVAVASTVLINVGAAPVEKVADGRVIICH